MEWLSIGEVAKKFGMENARLRDWCNNDLIEYEMRSNTRYIPTSEFEKIQKILDFFEEARAAGTRKTFNDVREMLIKENLFENHQIVLQEKEEISKFESSIETALKEIGFDEVIGMLGEKLNELSTKSDLEQLRNQIHERLIQEAEHKKKLEEELIKSNELNNKLTVTLHEVQEQMVLIENELKKLKEAAENEKNKKEGFFKRLFG